jgi:tetratricopeptide (TPR) repeat protein
LKHANIFLAMIAIGALLAAAPARAQPSAESEATAEELFRRGNAAIAEGKTREACTLFAESYRIEKAGGTLQNLAFCYESLGRWASAYARYEELLALSKRATPPREDRVQLAEEHIKKLTPLLSHVIVTMPQTNKVTGLAVIIDGKAFEEPAWSAGVLLDPGKHDVRVIAPGKIPFETTLVLEVQRDATVAVPPLQDVPNGAPVDPHPTRTAGIIVGASGLAVLAAGGVFGGLAIQNANAAKNACHAAPGSDPASYDPTGACIFNDAAWHRSHDDSSRAEAFANVSNVLVPVGAVAVVVGAVLYFRGPGQPERSARIVPTLGGAALEGSF